MQPSKDDQAAAAKHAGEAQAVDYKEASTSGSGASTASKKAWRINSLNDAGKLQFETVFEPNEETGEIEARYLGLRFIDEKGKEKFMKFNWLDIYMFTYFTCNEELRRNLAARYERTVNYIPYDVTIQLSPEEKATGIAKRRVQLQVDELQMAIARNEAYKMLMRTKDPRAFGARPRGR